MSFVLQSLEILETNQTYTCSRNGVCMKTKQTNDLTTEQSVESEKEPKIYGNKFRYRQALA